MAKEQNNKEEKKCSCGPDCTCGCQEGKECTCKDNNCKCGCHDKKECTCGCQDGKECTCDCDCSKNIELKETKDTLEKREKEIAELNAKANQILATASYYKNEAESAKKDYERFKERNKNIEEELKLKTNEEVAKKLLPIIDNFDQAIAHTDENIMKGFEMIYKSLVDMLLGLGIEEIETVGELNPEFHSCITTEPTEDEALENKIATVYQKGYKFKDSNKIVRVATVSVYKKQ